MKTKYKILFCEDDEFLVHLYVYRLQIEGYRVSLLRAGGKVIEHMQEKKPDLVVLDLMMPEKSGFQILEEIQKSNDDELKKIPIIVFSNRTEQRNIDKVKKLGAVDFLGKLETTPKELIDRIKPFLG